MMLYIFFLYKEVEILPYLPYFWLNVLLGKGFVVWSVKFFPYRKIVKIDKSLTGYCGWRYGKIPYRFHTEGVFGMENCVLMCSNRSGIHFNIKMDTVNVLVDSTFSQKYPKYPLSRYWFMSQSRRKGLKTLIYKHFTLYQYDTKPSNVTNNDCCEAVFCRKK